MYIMYIYIYVYFIIIICIRQVTCHMLYMEYPIGIFPHVNINKSYFVFSCVDLLLLELNTRVTIVTSCSAIHGCNPSGHLTFQ